MAIRLPMQDTEEKHFKADQLGPHGPVAIRKHDKPIEISPLIAEDRFSFVTDETFAAGGVGLTQRAGCIPF